MALQDYFQQYQTNVNANTTANPFPTVKGPTGGQLVQTNLEAMLNPNSDYIQNARQRGVEMAATRGGVNSSIAAGAAERSALEAAAPLAQTAVGIDAERANLEFQAQAENWMANQNFNRTFQSSLALLPVQSSFNMLEAVQQYALQDPELYTPEVISGYTNFFNKNMQSMLDDYFK